MGFEIFGFAVGMQDSFVFPHGLQLRVLALSEFLTTLTTSKSVLGDSEDPFSSWNVEPGFLARGTSKPSC